MIRAALLVLAAAASLSACGDDAETTTTQPTGATRDPSPTAEPTPTTTATTTQVRLGIDGTELVAVLRDTAAARDLVALLPTTVTVREHGGVEKTGPLPRALDVSEEPEGADPEVGDLGYYAPGNDLVLYHGDQGYYPGIVVLGRIDGDLQAIADAPDGVTVDVRPAP